MISYVGVQGKLERSARTGIDSEHSGEPEQEIDSTESE
jgi:hypothetical protein